MKRILNLWTWRDSNSRPDMGLIKLSTCIVDTSLSVLRRPSTAYSVRIFFNCRNRPEAHLFLFQHYGVSLITSR